MKEKRIDISLALKEGASGFKKWWFILSLVSFLLLIVEMWYHRYIVANLLKLASRHFKFLNEVLIHREQIHQSSGAYSKSVAVTFSGSPQFKLVALDSLIYKVLPVVAILFVTIAALYLVVVVISKSSMFDKKSGKSEIYRNINRTPELVGSYLILTLIKAFMLAAPFLIPILFILIIALFPDSLSSIIPNFPHFVHSGLIISIILSILLFLYAVYLYIRLYFTSFIITEESSNVFRAIKESIRMTKGHFKEIFLIFLITLVIDIISVITIVGFIPGTGFKYTVRASAYMQLKEEE